MKAQLNRIRPLDLVLFAIVAALVAVVVIIGLREAGLGERAVGTAGDGQEQASEAASPETAGDMSLTLTTKAHTCETERARESYGVTLETDENGNSTERKRTYGWGGIASLSVGWSVSGGDAPYSLVIDNESDLEYSGKSGTAMVGCADTSGGTSFDFGERRYVVDPNVDSGWKTVRAVVTDANGDTAEATTRFYVIRTDADLLRRGQTYRVWGGHLVTAPSSHDVSLVSPAEIECPESAPNDYRCEPSFGFLLLPDGHQGDWTTAIAQVNLYVTDGTEESRWRKLDDGTWIEVTAAVQAASDAHDPILAALDEIANSVGDPPRSR